MTLPDLSADLQAKLPRLRGRLSSGTKLADITWFRVGGPAQALFSPADEADLAYFLAGIPRDLPVTVVGLNGELDASTYEHVIDEVRGLYEEGARKLVLDLSGLTYMASSGLIALHSIVQVMRGEQPPDLEGGWSAFHALGNAVDGGRQDDVVLAAAQPAVERVLQRTGLDQLFSSHPDRAAAIAAV